VREERRQKKKQKKEDRSVDKRRGQYLADLAAKVKGPIVDLTDPTEEPVIDLTQDTKMVSKGRSHHSPIVIDKTGNGSKRIHIVEDEILRSDPKKKEKQKDGRDDASKQRSSVEPSVGKPEKESKKVHSFEEEMFRVERRYELLKKGRDDASKKQRPSTSLGRSSIVEQTSVKTVKDPKKDDSRRVHSFREEISRIDHSRFKLKKGEGASRQQHSGGQEKRVDEFEDDQGFDNFRRINKRFDKDAGKQHGLSSDVIDFVKLLDGVRKGEKRSPGI